MTVILMAAALLGCGGQGPQESPAGPGRRTGLDTAGRAAAPQVVPGEVLVRFRAGTDERLIERIGRECGLELVKLVAAPDLVLMRTVDGTPVAEALRRLKGFPEVLQAEPNAVRTLKEN